jgi:hypothetical protein
MGILIAHNVSDLQALCDHSFKRLTYGSKSQNFSLAI